MHADDEQKTPTQVGPAGDSATDSGERSHDLAYDKTIERVAKDLEKRAVDAKKNETIRSAIANAAPDTAERQAELARQAAIGEALHTEVGIELSTEQLKSKAEENLARVAALESEVAAHAGERRAERKEELMHSLHTEVAVKPLRTFRGDLAEAAKRKETSLVQIQAAEIERKAKETGHQTPGATRGVRTSIKAISLVLSVLLIIVGASAFIVLKYLASEHHLPRAGTSIETILPYDSMAEALVGNNGRKSILDAFELQRSAPLGNSYSIRYLRFETAGTGSHDLSIEEFFTSLGAEAPQGLLRAFDNTYMAGGISADGTIQPFLMIRITSFDNAYSGMLSWEKTLLKDLGPIFANDPATNAQPANPQADASSGSATGSPIQLPTEMPAENTRKRGFDSPFEDIIVNNVDTRAIRAADGSVAMLYAFLDHTTLLITNNEESLRAVITKYFASKLLR